ncbi:fungal-specific transcription factor domain-containing protein [Exophiala viscosa]|uniref:Fungal-specific transcription factor domain-containing protein n=1 Tax=Exophiala viscosa TaxID=2486360 RepID=A0AAN6DN15_9EURO|nr:fungal-specific transcription factor domain-containing protein [Exophiala viscosa]KAI1620888.1 fungal-specific transcription factor domain-containing protein [Exophiala viscosa]
MPETKRLLWRPIPRRNSRAGCATCKARRIKCDASVPGCLNCSRRSFTCPGYTRVLQWKEKHQVAQSASFVNDPDPNIPAETLKPDARIKGKVGASRDDSQLDNEYQHCSLGTQYRAIPPLSTNNDPFSSPILQKQPSPPATPRDEALVVRNATTTIATLRPSHLRSLNDRTVLLMAHYFRKICVINSCFDSFANPFRTEIPGLMATSRLVQCCILSMSAAHLRSARPEWSFDSLEYLTAAVSELMTEVNAVSSDSSLSTYVDQRLDNALLGAIMLGMTTSWHPSSGLGLEHIAGSRALFRTWIRHNFGSGRKDDENLSRLSLYLGLHAYWEAMASFLIDQDPGQLDYLQVAFTIPPTQVARIHPWTGVSAIPWVYLAKVGCMVRLKRNLANCGVRGRWESSIIGATVSSLGKLEEDAWKLAGQIMTYSVPSDEQIEDTFDTNTTKSHLKNLARCCQLAALLELQRSFDAVHEQQAVLDWISHADAAEAQKNASLLYTDTIRELSLRILQLLSDVPTNSGTQALHHLPLLIAGSVLLPHIMKQSPRTLLQKSIAERRDINEDATVSTIDFWRNFVMGRLTSLQRAVNLNGHRKIRLLLQEIWARGDALIWHPQALSAGYLHWVDVMEEKDLQFFF